MLENCSHPVSFSISNFFIRADHYESGYLLFAKLHRRKLRNFVILKNMDVHFF